MIRVVVVDDQEVVRTGFRTILDAAADVEVVGEAADGSGAVEVARRLRPEVVAMDVRMPRVDGIEATRRLAGPDVADPVRVLVLVLTTFDLGEHVFDALRAGASGLLLKDVGRDELLRAVWAVAAATASSRRRSPVVVAEFARLAPASAPDPAALAALTPREREVLVLVARGRTNAEVAEALVLSRPARPTSGGCTGAPTPRSPRRWCWGRRR